jgi:hypothetical protein
MALRFIDSFDHYATADFAQKWTSVNAATFSSTIVVGAYGRNSTNGLRFTWSDVNSHLRLQRTVTTSGSTAIMGAAVKVSAISGTSSANPLFSIWDGASIQTSLRIDAAGTLSVLRGSFGGTVLGTSVGVLSTATYYYIELKVVLHGSTGTYDVKVNGTSFLSGTGANTADAGTTAWTAARIGSDGSTAHISGGATWDFDDFYVCDGSGSANNDVLGPIRVKAVFPDGAGNSTQFTPSAGSNFQNVDEASQDGDTTYNSETTVGQKDLYTLGALGITGTVKGVQTNLIVRSDGGGAETIAPVWRIGATDYDGTTVGVTTSYADSLQVYETSPATGVAFTVAEIDGAELGIKLVS